MAVLPRAEIIAQLLRAGERLQRVNTAARSRALVRSGGEEALTPTPELPINPSVPLLGQGPGTGSATG